MASTEHVAIIFRQWRHASLTHSIALLLMLGPPIFLPCVTQHPVCINLLHHSYTEGLPDGFLLQCAWNLPSTYFWISSHKQKQAFSFLQTYEINVSVSFTTALWCRLRQQQTVNFMCFSSLASYLFSSHLKNNILTIF